MSDKYIIKNCPCFVEGIAIKGNEQQFKTVCPRNIKGKGIIAGG